MVFQGRGVVDSTPFKLHPWLLPDAVALSGLTAGTKCLGSVVCGGAAGMPNPTIARVDPWRADTSIGMREGPGDRPLAVPRR